MEKKRVNGNNGISYKTIRKNTTLGSFEKEEKKEQKKK